MTCSCQNVHSQEETHAPYSSYSVDVAVARLIIQESDFSVKFLGIMWSTDICFLPKQLSHLLHCQHQLLSIRPHTSEVILAFGCISVQFSSVTQSCLTLCDPMNRSTPSLPVHHQLLESTQKHVHRVSVAIQPSHPLLSPSLPALNLSQNQGLFKWVSSSHQVAKVLEFQHQST